MPPTVIMRFRHEYHRLAGLERRKSLVSPVRGELAGQIAVVLLRSRRQDIGSDDGADIVDSYLNELASLVRFCHLNGQRDFHKLGLSLRHGLKHHVYISVFNRFSPRRSNRFPAPTTARQLT